MSLYIIYIGALASTCHNSTHWPNHVDTSKDILASISTYIHVINRGRVGVLHSLPPYLCIILSAFYVQNLILLFQRDLSIQPIVASPCLLPSLPPRAFSTLSVPFVHQQDLEVLPSQSRACHASAIITIPRGQQTYIINICSN